MKLALCVLVLIAACTAIPEEDVYEKWVQYQKDFGKKYRSPVEATKRFGIFKAKLEHIEQHNKLYEEGKVTFSKGLSAFSDMTAEEFNQLFPKLENLDGDDLVTYTPKSFNGNLPPSVDWRTVDGVVSPVKNQGQCSSCYAFSVTGALEGLAKLATGNSVVLSEQAIMDCSHRYGNMGCNRGLTLGAFRFVRDYGIPTEESYSYTEMDGVCRNYTSAFTISDAVRVRGDETTLQHALYHEGPISITIDATQELSDYQGGVLNDTICTNEPNHAVLLVGYGTEQGLDYWLIKNSWGPNWGPDGGYYKMLRGANQCAIMSAPAYGVL